LSGVLLISKGIVEGNILCMYMHTTPHDDSNTSRVRILVWMRKVKKLLYLGQRAFGSISEELQQATTKSLPQFGLMEDKTGLCLTVLLSVGRG
jgi:hypothetical protein